MGHQGSLGTPEERQAWLLKVLQAEPAENTCQRCLGRLDGYVAAQIAGENYLGQFPEVAVHLDACLACADVYARLYELEVAEAANRLPQPNHFPQPDLSFLQTPSTDQPETDLITQVRAVLQRTADKITLRLSPTLLPLLQPLPSASLTRTPGDKKRYHEVLLHLDPIIDPDLALPFALTAYRDGWHPQHCLVEVLVAPAGQSWPDLDGYVVALDTGEEKRQTVTDTWGIASFVDVQIDDLPLLSIEIAQTKQGKPNP